MDGLGEMPGFMEEGNERVFGDFFLSCPAAMQAGGIGQQEEVLMSLSSFLFGGRVSIVSDRICSAGVVQQQVR